MRDDPVGRRPIGEVGRIGESVVVEQVVGAVEVDSGGVIARDGIPQKRRVGAGSGELDAGVSLLLASLSEMRLSVPSARIPVLFQRAELLTIEL